MAYAFSQNNKLSGVINNKILEYIYKVPLLSQEAVDELRNDKDLIYRQGYKEYAEDNPLFYNIWTPPNDRWQYQPTKVLYYGKKTFNTKKYPFYFNVGNLWLCSKTYFLYKEGKEPITPLLHNRIKMLYEGFHPNTTVNRMNLLAVKYHREKVAEINRINKEMNVNIEDWQPMLYSW